MQIIEPIIRRFDFRFILLFILSILLYGCNSNYMKVLPNEENRKESSGSVDKSEKQINIDELLLEKEVIEITNLNTINKIALLLPMTGKYSKIGKAILDGIEIELKDTSKYIKPELSIFDTGDEDTNLKKIYSEMLSNDFDYVIGPLRKGFIEKISKYSSKELPVLTLNYSNNLKKYSKKVYQFGLLPEDEAICIAEKAIIDGNVNASALYPDNTWGKRIVESFTLRFQELGGKVTNLLKYNRENTKINNSIKNLLNIEESTKRKNHMQNILKTKLQFKPHIANNLDMIFSVGKSQDMRLIKPQFNFNYAEDIPFYSTSHIYNGVYNKEINQDLNNIKFCDIPWLYNTNNMLEKKYLRESVDKRDLLRFVAIGMDSIKIIYNINTLKLNKHKYLLGNTGFLRLDEFNKIRRNLTIVKFKNGKAKEIPF
ncbi:MAG: penicillin-binding protein activator [Gammaproteobacteria bacterium]|nr:penicillin-binding protein activator [Gammaproteobacteria bacterium]